MGVTRIASLKSLSQNLLSARWGLRRVTIGLESPETLRRLSNDRALTCPGCHAPVVLHAGTVRAHHFAHLPGAVCSLPQTEPETEEHRAGKLLLAAWLRTSLPEAEVILEAYLPETGQRADVLVELPLERKIRRVALEFQCANLSAREWRRRHLLYRQAGIEDLWLLGGFCLHRDRSQDGQTTLRTGELERALLWDNAPLLFLDSIGENLQAGSLARFRPTADFQALHPIGKLSLKPLSTLPFPWNLLDWPQTTRPAAPIENRKSKIENPTPDTRHPIPSDAWLWEWLTQRFRVTPETLSEFFGFQVTGQEAFACEAQVWQAAIYYRFIHQRVGEGWWLPEIETWARAYLPLARPVALRRLRGALEHLQEIFAAAGLLSLPMGYNRVNARILADLTTLTIPPDREETLRIARYRRTLARESQSVYSTESPL